jgi:hypothetical protein
MKKEKQKFTAAPKEGKKKSVRGRGMKVLFGDVTPKKPDADMKPRSPGTVKAMRAARAKRLNNVLI